MKKQTKKRERQIESQIKLGLIVAFFVIYYFTNSFILTAVFMFYLILITIGFFIYLGFKRKRELKNSGIEEIDKMDGIQFERYLRELYTALGYKAKVTKSTGDFGADLVLQKNDKKIVVQAKRYSKNVGVKAIQEAKTAQLHYKAQESWVVTNSYYTQAARELANSNNVILTDRDQLIKHILTIRSSQKDAV